MADLHLYHNWEMTLNTTLQWTANISDLAVGVNITKDGLEQQPHPPLNWGVLALSLLIFATATGNILVCLAVCWEKRLQNMTNYFLMSLAIADLLVAILVMPLAMLVELYGYFPLDESVCVLWASMDVLMCTASIWHMCTMSMDRYFTLKYPMKYGRNKTKTMVVLKITFVWVISMFICSPLCIMGFVEYRNVYNNGICVITVREFVVYGSIFAFYIPLTIMVITYSLTIQILCTNQKLMRSIVREHSLTLNSRVKKEKNGKNQAYTNGAFLTPQFVPRFMDRPSVDTSVSYNASVNESCILSTSESQKDDDKIQSPPKEEVNIPIVTTEATESDRTSPYPNSMKLEDMDQLSQTDVKSINSEVEENSPEYDNVKTQIKPSLSVSQPHLPSMSHSRTLSSEGSQKQQLIPRARSHLSVYDLESVKNFDSISGASSLNSMLSREHLGSGAWSDFEDPEMLEKLSQIEAEMDECLTTVDNVSENFNDDVFEDPQRRQTSSLCHANKSQVDLTIRSSSSSKGTIESPTSESAKSSDGLGSASDDLKTKTFTFPPSDKVPSAKLMMGDKSEFMAGVNVESETLNSSSSDDESFCQANIKHGISFSTFLSNNQMSSRNIPPVRISQSSPIRSQANSDRTSSDSMDSDKSGFITIQLNPSGCYLYQVDYTKSQLAAPDNKTVASRSSKDSPRSTSPCLSNTETKQRAANMDDTIADSTEDGLSEGGGSQSTISASVGRKYSPHTTKKIHSTRPQGYATGWKTFLRRKKKAKIANGHITQIISKRTASNEKKASKVLGIIFAVFCALWTPFFIVNVLSVACEACMKALTPQMMAGIAWLGYLSSLANPIIYTMFNTSFRRAFYKILTCQYKLTMSRRKRHRQESMYLTNASGWSSNRRPTLTGQNNPSRR